MLWLILRWLKLNIEKLKVRYTKLLCQFSYELCDLVSCHQLFPLWKRRQMTHVIVEQIFDLFSCFMVYRIHPFCHYRVYLVRNNQCCGSEWKTFSIKRKTKKTSVKNCLIKRKTEENFRNEIFTWATPSDWYSSSSITRLKHRIRMVPL